MNEWATREAEWAQWVRDVDQLRDGLLRPVDPLVRDVVLALRANGFDTSSSCQGHLDGWQPYPIVSFNAPLVERGLWPPPLVPSYRNELRRHMTQALGEFYETRNPLERVRLVVISGSKPGLVLVSGGAKQRAERSPDEERAFLEASQKEMSLLAEFLRKRFFEKGRLMKEWSPASSSIDPATDWSVRSLS